MRKFLSVFLAALMITFSLPVVTYADEALVYAAEDDEYEYEYDADNVTFILTADKEEAVPGDTVNFVLSVTADGRIYGLQANWELPDGFTYIKGSGKLFDGTGEALNWDFFNFSELSSGMQVAGYTYDNPYAKAKELKLAEFSCKIEDYARTETVSLNYFTALDISMDNIPDPEGIFPEISVVQPKYYISIPDYITVTRNDIELADGDEIETNDFLIITAQEREDFVLTSLTVNDRPFKSGGEFTVSRDNVEIKAVFTEIRNYRIFIPNNVTVTRDGVELYNNDEVTSGDELMIKADVPNGYRFASLTVNGERFTSARITYMVVDSDVDIDVEFTQIEYYKVYIPYNVTVTRDGDELYNNDEVTSGDELIIKADVPDGYRFGSFTVNGEKFTSRKITYTVTDSDVEIDVEFTEIEHYMVFIPNDVTVTRDGAELNNNDEVTAGDELVITANVPDGYRFASLTVNGEKFTSTRITYTAADGDVEIEVEFTEIEHYMVFIPDNVTVTRGGVELFNNAEVTEGDELKITAKAPDGKRLGSLTVNEKPFTSGGIYTVTDENVDIEVEFIDIVHTVYIPGNVTVTHSGVKLDDGDEVNENDILIITANAPEGQALTSLTINGKPFKSGDAFTVGTEDVVIEAEFTDIGNYTVKIPSYVTVTRGGTTLSNGAAVTTGEVLTIRVNVPSGYRLVSLTVNGGTFTSGNTYTVTSEDVEIAVNLQKLVQYTVTVPSNVTVTRDGAALKNGSAVYTGDTLTITANPPSGYRLNSLTVNGGSFSSGSRYTVGSANVTIAVTFSKIPSSSSGSGNTTIPDSSTTRHYVFIPDNVVVRRSNRTLEDGDEIFYRDKLTITAKVPNGKKLVSLTVNDKTFKSGNTYTAGNEHVYIDVEFDDLDALRITIPGGVSVTHGSNAVNNGDIVSEGDVLVITANVPEGYKLASLAVNGKEIANKAAYTAGKEDPVITVRFEKLPEVKPAEPFNISQPEMSGWTEIIKTAAIPTDKTIRIDMNGTTLLPKIILQVIKYSGNKLLLKMDDKVSWTIEGKDVINAERDVDLKVTLETKNIPEDAVKRLADNNDYLTLTLAHNGELGFKGLLVVELGDGYNAENASLYRYGNNAFTAEGRCDVLHGKGVMEFTHASEWIVVFKNGTDDPNSNNSSTSTPGTSKPPASLPNDNDKNDPNKNNSSTSTSTSNSNSGSNEKDNPVTGGTRVSLTAFLLLVASAAAALVTRKRRQ